MDNRLAFEEGKLGAAKAAQGFLVHGLLAGSHQQFKELCVAIDDRLLCAGESALIDLDGFLVVESGPPPLGRLALHELLGLDDLADLLHKEIIHQNGVGPLDDLVEILDDFFDRFARPYEMILRLVQIVLGIAQVIARSLDLVGTQATQLGTGLGEGDRSAFFGESVRFKIVEQKGHPPDRTGHSPADPILTIHLGTEALPCK